MKDLNIDRCSGRLTVKAFFYITFFTVTMIINIHLSAEELPKLKIGHVGHDHHLALFVALDSFNQPTRQNIVYVKKVVDKKYYELYNNGKKEAILEIVRVGGGSKMPTALSQGIIDIGFGGVAPVLASVDKGAPVKLISPLHYKGDMFVLDPKIPVSNWQEFIRYANSSKKPLRIGYKNPVAVAKIIFEDALKAANISFNSKSGDSKAKVHLINVKGGEHLNTSLANGIIDGYVGNNPFPAIGESKGLLKTVCDLDALPPGNFKNHPCCCIAINTVSTSKKRDVIVDFLKLMAGATNTINTDIKSSSQIASRWIGTDSQTEAKSIKSSGYSVLPDKDWQNNMTKWIDAMQEMKLFTKHFKDLPSDKVKEAAFDLTIINEAVKN